MEGHMGKKGQQREEKDQQFLPGVLIGHHGIEGLGLL